MKVLLAHVAWRRFPCLVWCLPDLVCAGVFQSVQVDFAVGGPFREPRAPTSQGILHADRANPLKDRARTCMNALEALVAWAKDERKTLIGRMACWDHKHVSSRENVQHKL